MGIIYLGKHDDRDLYQLIIKMYNDIAKIIAVNKLLQMPNYYLMQECLEKIAFLDVEQIDMLEYDINKVEPITYCLQPLLAVEVLLGIGVIITIYMQPSKSDALSGLIQGSTNDTFFSKNKSRTKEAVLVKLTVLFMALFAINTIVLNLIK